MKRIHYFSGLFLTIFIGLHLFNHCTSVLGVESHITWMERFRWVYRNLLVETFLLLSVFIQVISGLRLFFSKRKKSLSFWPKVQLWSGVYMAFFLLIHVTAVLVGRTVLDLDTNFYFGAAGLNSYPVNLFFIPYYGMAILSFFGHIASIHAQKMPRSLFGITPNHQATLILGLGFLTLLIIFFGLTNGFSGIDLPENYQLF